MVGGAHPAIELQRLIHMTQTSATLEELVGQFSRLPGIGRKTAFRLAYHVLKAQPEAAHDFAGEL